MLILGFSEISGGGVRKMTQTPMIIKVSFKIQKVLEKENKMLKKMIFSYLVT